MMFAKRIESILFYDRQYRQNTMAVSDLLRKLISRSRPACDSASLTALLVSCFRMLRPSVCFKTHLNLVRLPFSHGT